MPGRQHFLEPGPCRLAEPRTRRPVLRGNEDRRSANFLVGGQIDKIVINACRERDFWTGAPRNTVTGKGAVTVHWQVFSQLDRKVVDETTTEGAATVKQGAPDGELFIIQDAFANAVQNLAGDKGFVDVLSQGAPSIATSKISMQPLWPSPPCAYAPARSPKRSTVPASPW